MMSNHALMKKHCPMPFDSEAATKELTAAGWKRNGSGIWMSPRGEWYKGVPMAFAIFKEKGDKA